MALNLFPSLINEKYRYIKPLGDGGAAQVALYKDITNSSEVAIKFQPKSKCYLDYQETEILDALIGTLGVLQLIECLETDDHIYIVTEYFKGEELFYFIQKRNLKDSEIKIIFIQILSIMSKVHDKGIVHRDLSLCNIMINNKLNIKIIDFGLARFIDSGLPYRLSGSWEFLPPEYYLNIDNPPRPSILADTWAIGCIFFAIITKRFPFSGYMENMAGGIDWNYIDRVKDINICWEFMTKKHRNKYKNLIIYLLTNESERLNCQECMNTTFFKI